VQGNEQGYDDEIKKWKYGDWGQLILIDVCFIDVMIVCAEVEFLRVKILIMSTKDLNICKKCVKTAES
jgi:hypothetical protein